MSYIGAVQNCAEDIQDALEMHFTGNGNGISPDQRPFLQFVNNQVKTAGIKQVINPSPAKKKTVNLLYRQPLVHTDIDQTDSTNCTTGDDLGNMLEEYTIDTADGGDWNGLNATFALSQLHCIDEPFEVFFAKELARLVDGVDAKVSYKTATTLATLSGTWADDVEATYTVTANRLQVDYQDSSNNYNPSRFYEVMDAVTMNGFGSNVAMFGGAKLHGLARHALAGCCTSNGVELQQLWGQFGFASVYDRDVATALGSGSAYSVITKPGAVALLTFNEAGWKNGVSLIQGGSNYIQFSIVSPKTGTPMDVLVTDACKAVTISVRACTKLVGLPTDLFQSNDNFSGVKFVNKLQAV